MFLDETSVQKCNMQLCSRKPFEFSLTCATKILGSCRVVAHLQHRYAEEANPVMLSCGKYKTFQVNGKSGPFPALSLWTRCGMTQERVETDKVLRSIYPF